MSFNFNVLQDGILLLSKLKDFAKKIPISYKHHIRRQRLTFQRVIEDYYKGDIASGETITVEGFLSKYVLTYRDGFYTPYCHRATGFKAEPDIVIPWREKIQLTVSNEVTQLPLQAVPPFRSGAADDECIHIFFLYPSEHNSFILDVNDEKYDRLKNNKPIDTLLYIPERVRPILITSPECLQRYSEKIVRITAKLTSVEERISESFTSNMSHIQQVVLSNSIRPFAESIESLCIDLRGNHEITPLGVINSLNGMLYIESHLEQIDAIPDYQKLMGDSLPDNFPGLRWWSMNSDISWGLTNSEILLAASNYSKFAFSIETNLLDERSYESSLRKLHSFTHTFSKRVQNHVRALHNKEIKMKYDFLFDYRKARLFHPDGVLVSKEVSDILKTNPNMADDINWLRNSSKTKPV